MVVYVYALLGEERGGRLCSHSVRPFCLNIQVISEFSEEIHHIHIFLTSLISALGCESQQSLECNGLRW